MATQTPTIDCQVHAYERNHPERPWSGFLQGPDEVTGDDMVAAMDALRVDGALLISPFSLYGYDASYALEVYAKHPGRFGLIRPFDPESETIEDDVAEWNRDARRGRSADHAYGPALRSGRPRAQPHPRRRRKGRRSGEHHVFDQAAPFAGTGPAQSPTLRL